MTETTDASTESPVQDIKFNRVKAGSPAADCMAAVEEIIRGSSGEYSKNTIYRKLPVHLGLPRDAMNTMFMQIMDYLLESKKISVDRVGHICWTYNPGVVDCYQKNPQLKFPSDNSKGCIFFDSKETLSGYNALLASSNLEEQHVLKSVNNAVHIIEDNIFSGELIPKRLIPKKYNRIFESCNLWRYSLGNSWKLIYHVSSGDCERIALIADYLNNKDFERLFGDL
ncbi:MAG: hypothetical protein JXQ82_05670 [Methanomicrobiaceae archaeon]|nr:hypothetical protein [Methanomicrobiaceae archaeon]